MAVLVVQDVASGEQLDRVTLDDGELKFQTGAAEPLFEAMIQGGVPPEEALALRTGWSNGYVRTSELLDVAKLPPIPGLVESLSGGALTAAADDLFKFNPNQPRDARGRWTKTPGGPLPNADVTPGGRRRSSGVSRLVKASGGGRGSKKGPTSYTVGGRKREWTPEQARKVADALEASADGKSSPQAVEGRTINDGVRRRRVEAVHAFPLNNGNVMLDVGGDSGKDGVGEQELTPAQARELAEILRKNADRDEGKKASKPDAAPAPAPAPAPTARWVKAPADIGTPSADGKVGKAPKEAAMTAEWKAHNDSLSDAQRKAVKTYSTTDYLKMNGVLRKPPGSKLTAEEKKFAKESETLQSAMAPAPRGVKVYRGSNLQSLGLPKDASAADMKAMLGKTVINDAFTSTSTDPNEIFGGNLELEIEVPEGTPSIWMNGNARVPSEQELLLAAGSKMQITGVRETPPGSGQYKVKGRIVA
jgi:hypothetical protein